MGDYDEYGRPLYPTPAASPGVLGYLAKPLWLVAALGVAIAAVFLLPLKTRINFGGILGWLLGKPSPKDTLPSVAVPSTRQVSVGSPDGRGQVQAPSQPIVKSWSPFARKDVVQLPSGERVQLPEGVRSKDVQDVITAMPGQAVVVRVKPGSPPAADAARKSPRDLLAELKRIQQKHVSSRTGASRPPAR